MPSLLMHTHCHHHPAVRAAARLAVAFGGI